MIDLQESFCFLPENSSHPTCLQKTALPDQTELQTIRFLLFFPRPSLPPTGKKQEHTGCTRKTGVNQTAALYQILMFLDLPRPRSSRQHRKAGARQISLPSCWWCLCPSKETLWHVNGLVPFVWWEIFSHLRKSIRKKGQAWRSQEKFPEDKPGGVSCCFQCASWQHEEYTSLQLRP